MADITVSVSLNDFFDSWNQEDIAKTIRDSIAKEVIAKVKRDKRYKALIDKQVENTISLMTGNGLLSGPLASSNQRS